MSPIARDLTRRLAEAGIEASALALAVNHVLAARAEAINAQGLRSQIEFLLGTYVPSEIEKSQRRNRTGRERLGRFRPGEPGSADGIAGAARAMVAGWQVAGRRVRRAKPQARRQAARIVQINRNGRWADWAADAKGGDVVSLAAYLAGLSQAEAARELAGALGIEPT